MKMKRRMQKRTITEKFCPKNLEINDRIAIFVASLYETNPQSSEKP